MKEALIVFIIALVIGSIMNSMKDLDVWGVGSSSAESAANKIPAVNEANFDQTVIQSSDPVLVDFYTDNSDTSKQMVPILCDLSTDLRGRVKIVRMDANESPIISDRYAVKGVPDFILFNKGEKLDHVVGPQSKDQMLSFLRKYVKLQETPVSSPSQDNSNNQPPPASGTFQG